MRSSSLIQSADSTHLPPHLFAQDLGRVPPPTPRNSPHNPKDSREILPPGQLHREDSDSALTGITRSLQRRLLGLRDLALGRNAPTSTEKEKKPD